MSNTTIPESSENDAPSWNTSQLLTTIGVVGLGISALLINSKLEDTSKPKDSNLQKAIIKAFEDKSNSFQGLPIIRIGNPEEIHTLKSSGKDGWYLFQEGNTITCWKIRSGIIESNTYTLTQ